MAYVPEIQFPLYKGILSGAIFEYFRIDFLPDDLYKDTDSRARSLRRARTRLRRVINANAGQWWDEQRNKFYLPLFVTLTFRENITSIPVANLKFNRFIGRVNRRILKSRKAVLRYSRVIEFQKRGAVHYHLLFYNVPFIDRLHDKIAAEWGHGFTFENTVKLSNVRNTGAYVVKYMSKAHDDPRLRGKKLYASSQGLIQPRLIRDEFRLADILENIPSGGLISSLEADWGIYERYFIGDSALRYLNSGRPVGGDKPVDTVDNFLLQGRLF